MVIRNDGVGSNEVDSWRMRKGIFQSGENNGETALWTRSRFPELIPPRDGPLLMRRHVQQEHDNLK